MSKLEEAARGTSSLFMEGTVIAVDPSSGSTGSMPAYALSQDGILVDSGRIELDLKMPLHRRLYQLQVELLSIVQHPDLVVVEALPPYMGSAGGGFRNQGTVNLLQSQGAIFCTYEVENLLEVCPASWHRVVVEMLWDKDEKPKFTPALLKPEFTRLYKKTDEHDAQALLITAARAAGSPILNEKEVSKKWKKVTRL